MNYQDVVCEMESREKTCIVLGIFNGTKFLKDQIDSFYAQTVPLWVVVSRDDGSSDNSEVILKNNSLCESRIFYFSDNKNNLGVTANFGYLIELAYETHSDYVACSDQDDVWVLTKLAEQLKRMIEIEVKYPNKPVSIHSDLEVVDGDLNRIHPSFMQYNGIHHENVNPQKVLITQNFVTGCTVLVN